MGVGFLIFRVISLLDVASKKFFFTVFNPLLKQDIDIPTGHDVAYLGKSYFIILSNRSTSKTWFLLDYKEHLNTMEKGDL